MHPHRRRKKRATYGVRTIEINRGKNGFGFTISGQAPCILSCIITGSPAEKAGLRPGDYLIAVNGQNVSKALHDDVVELIGASNALKLQIAENYYSDSSEDEHTSFKLRSKCSNKLKHRQHYSSTSRAERVVHDLQTGALFNAENHMSFAPSKDIRNHFCSSEVFLEHTKDLLSEYPVHKLMIPDDKAVSLLHSALQNDPDSFNCNLGMQVNSFFPHKSEETEDFANDIFHSLFEEQELENISHSSLYAESKNDLPFCVGNEILKVVVGYLGTVEMPKETQVTVSRLQTIRNCIRRLQIEKKVHTHVLMSLYPQSIILTNIQGSNLAEFQADKITFFGVYSDNKNFFGLETRHKFDLTNENKSVNMELVSSSCHIFMVDSRLTPHHQHIGKAKAFRFICTCDSESNICKEFPNSAEVILKGVAGLYGSRCFSEIPCCTVSHEQSLNTSSNSSNSDSGIGFRDEGITGSKVLNEGGCYQFTSVPSIHDQSIVSYRECSTLCGSPYSLGYPAMSDNPTESKENMLHKNFIYNINRLTVRVMPDPIGFHRTFQDTGNCSHNIELSCSKYIDEEENAYDILKSKSDVSEKTAYFDNIDEKDLVNFQLQNIQSKLSPKVYDYAKEHILKMSIENASANPSECQCHMCTVTDKCARSEKKKEKCDLQSHKENVLFGTVKSIEVLEMKKRLLKSSSLRRHVSRRRNLISGTYDVGTVSDGELTLPRFATCTLLTSDHVSDTSLHGNISDGPKVGCVASWAAGFHLLLEDPIGLRVFNEFLKDEFSQENIVFWIACENYRHITDTHEMAKTASEIYLRHLRIGACEPVNVDSHARRTAEEGLEFPTENIFVPAQTQIFNLMKFDCYQRFLKSPVFKECLMCEMKGLPLRLENSRDSEHKKEQDTEQKLISEERKKKFLFPWSKLAWSKNSYVKTKAKQTELVSTENQKIEENLDDAIGSQDCDDSRSIESESGMVSGICHVISQKIANSNDLSKYDGVIADNHTVSLSFVLFGVELPDKRKVGVKAKRSKTCGEILGSVLWKYGYRVNEVTFLMASSLKPVHLDCSVSAIEKKRILVHSTNDGSSMPEQV